LELLYGRAASVAIAEADGWVRVRVTVPVDPGAVE
jgi:hypothetical protein